MKNNNGNGLSKNKEEIEVIERSYREYSRSIYKKVKNKKRNRLYDMLQSFIVLEMKRFLKQRKYFMGEGELLSVSWDCFLFALNGYKEKNNINIIQHTNKYTTYGMLIHFVNKNKHPRHVPYSVISEYLIRPERNINLYGIIEELKSIYEELSSEDRIVFEDALLSMTGNKEQRLERREKTSLDINTYREIKNMMKGEISLIVNDRL